MSEIHHEINRDELYLCPDCYEQITPDCNTEGNMMAAISRAVSIAVRLRDLIINGIDRQPTPLFIFLILGILDAS
jgi:hypothetical protein